MASSSAETDRSKRQIWGLHLQGAPDALMLAFCAGRDVRPLPMADSELLPFDLWTNRAHVIMLARQGICSQAHAVQILAALNQLESDAEAGRFALDPQLEDVHVNIEAYVTRHCGAAIGGQLHSGRSRNDQVACDMRLYLRAALLEQAETLTDLVATLLEQAREHRQTLLPGITHHQPAMLTSWGHWLAAHAQALLRDLERLAHSLTQLDRNPLGAAAAYGTSWPIDRQLTTQLLGFNETEWNTLDAISARWEHEAQVAFVYAALFDHLAVLGQDLLLLSHPYWGLLTLSDAHVTGSSIMPQKRNPDLIEVTKGKASWLAGVVAGLLGIPKGNPSGYHRDTQLTKYVILDVVRECQPATRLFDDLLRRTRVNAKAMGKRLTGGVLAADWAEALAREVPLPFREAYNVVALAIGKGSAKHGAGAEIDEDSFLDPLRQALSEREHAVSDSDFEALWQQMRSPQRLLERRQHMGAPSAKKMDEQIRVLTDRNEKQRKQIVSRQQHVSKAYDDCRSYRF